MSVQTPPQVFAFNTLGYLSRSAIAGSGHVVSTLHFIKKLFSIAAVPFDIPTSSVQGFQFLHVLVTFNLFLC